MVTFPHRAAAALTAISLRLSGDNFSALTKPPFKPPNLPRAMAAGISNHIWTIEEIVKLVGSK